MKNRQTKILGMALLLAGVVLCGAGLWLVLSPAQYAATARIKVMEMDEQEAEEYFQVYPEKRPKFVYDYYSYGPAIYKLRSQSVLTNVIDRLKLGINWQKIQRQMRINPVRNTKLIAITFFSNDSKEAADVANAIAEAYSDYRIQVRRKMTKEGLEVLAGHYQEGEKRIGETQTRIDSLHQQLGVQDQSTITNHPPEQQAYWDEKRQFDQMLKFHKLIEAQIEVVKNELENPRSLAAQFVDRAKPPQKPVGPNRFLGLALSLAGLLSLLTGAVLLKSACRQPA